MRPSEVTRALLDSLDVDDVGVALRCERVELVRPSKNRPIFHCHLAGHRPVPPVAGDLILAKGHGRGEGPRVHRASTRLWASTFAGETDLRIPRPVALMPGGSVALQEFAAGESLYEHIDRPASAEAMVPAVARWLLKLHGAPIAGFEEIGASLDVAAKARTHADALARERPAEAAVYVALHESVADDAGTRHTVVTHGDFQPKNIHLDGDAVVVIDLDRMALSSPARDVAHFLAQSMTMSFVRTGTFADIECWTEPFLDVYRNGAPRGALDELPKFVVASMLEILYYRLVVKPVRDASFVPAWLQEAQRWGERVA